MNAGRIFVPGKIAKLDLDVDEDAAAMMRLAAGDHSALAEIIARHQRSVFNLAYRFLQDPSLAEDLAQEAFLRIYSVRKKYKPTAKFTTYLYRVVANLCLSEIRSRTLRKTYSINGSKPVEETELPVREKVGRTDSARDSLEEDELAAKVREAVQSLPANQRIAVILSRYEGLSYAEIAKVMSISVMAVKALLVRAREKVREKLLPYLGRKN
jgi:RNA polymerase sigma-70 factor (ECF subfamily)